MLLYIVVSVPSGLQSNGGGTQLKLTIYNNRAEAVTLYWVNYTGAAVKYHTLQPNQGYIQRTYGSHPWIVADAQDNVIAAFTPYTSDLKITIE